MAKKYTMLDWDWAESPEFEEMRARYGKRSLVDGIQVLGLMSEFGGFLDTKDPMQFAHATKKLRTNEQGVVEILDRCADVGLIDPDVWRAFGRAGSARALRDARARENRKQWGEYMQNLSTEARNALENEVETG